MRWVYKREGAQERKKRPKGGVRKPGSDRMGRKQGVSIAGTAAVGEAGSPMVICSL